jgi:hypothetical protein
MPCDGALRKGSLSPQGSRPIESLCDERFLEQKMPNTEQPKWGKWGTWEDTESFLNKEIGLTIGADEVEKGTIRHWLEAKEFDCPLHFDEETAKRVGYKGIVAPWTMVITYGAEPYWRPGNPHARLGDRPKQVPLPVLDVVPAPCTLSFASDIEMEFFAPMYVGDRISCSSKLISITRKELRVGKGAFLTQENTYKNQRGEVVSVMRISIFRFAPPEKKED